MNAAKMMQEINTLDPSELDICTLREIYKRSICHAVKRIIGVYPMENNAWKPDTYLTYAENAERFNADVLRKYYQGNPERYNLRFSLDPFAVKDGNKIKLTRCNYGTNTIRLVINLLYVIGYRLDPTVSLPAYPEVSAIIDNMIKDLPWNSNPYTFTKDLTVGPFEFGIKAFKNGWIQIKGLTPDMEAELAELKNFCDLPM